MKKYTPLLTGMFVCLIVTLSSTYILLKTGAGVVVDTVVLSIICLSVLRSLFAENVFLSDVFSRASISAVSTIVTYFAVLFLFGKLPTTSNILYFIGVIIVSGCLGIQFYSGFEDLFLSEHSYRFPQLQPRIELLKSASKSLAKNEKLCISGACASIYAFLVNAIHLLPSTVKINNLFAFDNSLVLVSTGFL